MRGEPRVLRVSLGHPAAVAHRRSKAPPRRFYARRGSRSVQLLTPMAIRMRSMDERAPSFCLSWVQLLAIVL